jgi:hypothetical protein
MNKFFPAEETVIAYKQKKLPTITYAKMNDLDKDYLRYMYSMFYGHILDQKDTDAEQRGLYTWFFDTPQDHLPRPSKRAKVKTQYNTWASFLQGVEHNFLDGTDDFSLKQLEYVVEAVNMSVKYFNDRWPDFEPNTSANYVKLLKI